MGKALGDTPVWRKLPHTPWSFPARDDVQASQVPWRQGRVKTPDQLTASLTGVGYAPEVSPCITHSQVLSHVVMQG